MKGTIAITGATGFVGQTLLDLAVRNGWQVRALARKAQKQRDAVNWIEGSLDSSDALAALLNGVEAVIHVAGVTNAPSRDAFIRGNVTGTASPIAAAKMARVSRFIHVSSLTAREPALSTYGWSKAEAEKLVTASGLDWTIVRPPGVFGPGDRDHLDLFKAARWHIVPLPAHGRISVIEVSDLASMLLTLPRDKQSCGRVYEVDDGVANGWDHRDFGRAIAKAAESRAMMLSLPSPLIRFGAKIDGLLRGKDAKLTADRAAYFCHPDWTIDPAKRPPASLWLPRVATQEGLKATADAYRAAGWL